MSKRHRQRRCQLNKAVAVLSNIIKQHGLCKPVRFTRPHISFSKTKKNEKKNGAYGLFLGAVMLSLPRRENGCKPFCNAACAELGLFRISIAFPRRCAVVSAAA